MKKNTLASHNIRILFWADLFGSIRFLAPVLTLFYYARGLDETVILWVLLFWSTGCLVGEVPTGIFADRYGAKLSFIIGALFHLISQVLLIWAFDPWLFFVSSFISGFSATFFSGADEALIYESLKESNEENLMDKAMGIIQSAQSIVMIFVVILGAIIAKDLANNQFILLILLGASFQLFHIILLFFVRNPEKQVNFHPNPFNQVKEGIKAIQKAPQVLWMFLNVTLVFIPTAAIFDNFDQKLLTNAGLPVYFIGFVYAIASIISFAASRSIGWMSNRFSRIKLLYITGGLGFLGLLLAGIFQTNLWVILGVVVALRFVRTVRYPIYSQLSNDLIPSNVRATTISLLSIIDSICDLIIFSSLSGIAVFGLKELMIASAVIALIGSFLPIKPAPKIKTEELIS